MRLCFHRQRRGPSAANACAIRPFAANASGFRASSPCTAGICGHSTDVFDSPGG